MAPRIETVEGTALYAYIEDHNPPHFHAIRAEYEAQIDIRTLKVIKGKLPKTALKTVVEWAEANRDAIIAKWDECNPEKPYDKK